MWLAVLARCHDAIKILESNEKRFQGPFRLRKVVKPQSTEEKYKSPLVKMSEPKIAFSEIPTKDNNKSAFSKQLNDLLQDIGLLNEAVELDDDPEPSLSSNVPKGTSPPPPPHISIRKDEPPFRNYTVNNRLQKMVQTDPLPKCADCEKRKKIVYKTNECQTGELMTYSISTQVSEDDFSHKLPKKQSLASLTPAQLLAQNAASSSSKRYIDSDDFDIYPSKTPFYRAGYDYSRGSDGFGNSRYTTSDRDREFRDENPNSAQYQGARGRGSSNNNFEVGHRYGYY